MDGSPLSIEQRFARANAASSCCTRCAEPPRLSVELSAQSSGQTASATAVRTCVVYADGSSVGERIGVRVSNPVLAQALQHPAVLPLVQGRVHQRVI